jgi:NRAMP (natural resistance-associated macrophage protein)-like metal ion transporter
MKRADPDMTRPHDNEGTPVTQTSNRPETTTACARKRSFLGFLGPGLITGAADDDPSGIATYSQAGAQFGLGLAWTMLFTFPLLACIQEISARIGRTTGKGIAANLRDSYPRPLLVTTVGLLTIANTINLGADLGAMGEALKLLAGGAGHVYVIAFALFCAIIQIFVTYGRYVYFLKWLTLALLAYVATVLVIEVSWREVLLRTLVPAPSHGRDYLIGLVAVFGTTIAPYLMFWQAAEEVDEIALRPESQALIRAPEAAPAEIRRIRLDTYVGIAISNIIGLCIIVSAAVTLHANGITTIETAAQAAEALRPIAGPFAFIAFAAGIVGTGLLAVPVLAGSSAYAIGEAVSRPVGLGRKPQEALTFYGVIAVSTLIGVAIHFSPVDPIKALYWSAVVNGVLSVPIMAVTISLASQPRIMGSFVLPAYLRWGGWASTLIIAVIVVGMLAALFI